MTPPLRAAPAPAVAILAVSVAAAFPSPSAHAQALGGQWYAGVGGGASLLEPNSDAGLDVDENVGTAATAFVGRDLDDRASVQLQLHALGEAEFENGESVEYLAGDASVLYRFFDTRDTAIVPRAANLAVYGRFGLGFMSRDPDEDLEDDSPVWFGAGAGLELGIGRNAALRLEGIYHDTDAGAAFLSVLARFGGARRGVAPRAPDSATSGPATPPPPSAPATTGAVPLPAPGPLGDSPTTAADAAGSGVPPLPGSATVPTDVAAPGRRVPIPDDADGDGVGDAADACPRSATGFPVRDNGCALLDGVLAGVRFVDGGAALLSGATDQLDYLANVLGEYPGARVELHSHTDGVGTPRDQAILTRARLRTVGTYLVGRGVAANRLVLRSFGGSRPIADDGSAEARAENNRIEVLENVQR